MKTGWMLTAGALSLALALALAQPLFSAEPGEEPENRPEMRHPGMVPPPGPPQGGPVEHPGRPGGPQGPMDPGMAGGPAGLEGEFWRGPMAEELNLTDKQKEQMKEIQYKAQQGMIDLHARMQKAQLALQKESDKEKVDEDAVMKAAQEAADAGAAIFMAQVRLKLDMGKVLTSEQKKKLEKMQGPMREHRKEMRDEMRERIKDRIKERKDGNEKK